MTSTSKNARVAGFLYLLLTIAAPSPLLIPAPCSCMGSDRDRQQYLRA